VTVKVVDVLGGQLLEDAWALYYQAFEELNAQAVQRHLMHFDEFAAVMADGRVRKFLALGGAGELVGLAAYTNDLDAVPLISPAYFRRRWPQHYADGRIWYVEFVAVADSAPVTTFPELIAAMHDLSGRAALTVLDVCRRTDQVRHLPRSTRALLHRLDGPVRCERLDEQTYWLYEFVAPDGQL